MTRYLVVAACAWLAACSGRGDGDPPQLSPLLGGPERREPPADDTGGGERPPQVEAQAGGEPAPEPGDDVENLPPELVSFEAEQPAVEVGGSTALTVRVRDAERDPFYLWWEASCGIVSATATDGTRAVFLAPDEPGACTVTVQLQDEDLQRTRQYAYAVQVVPAAELEVTDELR